jgi:hypothetical protein
MSSLTILSYDELKIEYRVLVNFDIFNEIIHCTPLVI